MENFLKLVVLALAGFVAVILISLLFGFPTMWLWNYLMPELFGLKVISFWQAVGLNVLCGIMFKSNTTIKKD